MKIDILQLNFSDDLLIQADGEESPALIQHLALIVEIHAFLVIAVALLPHGGVCRVLSVELMAVFKCIGPQRNP